MVNSSPENVWALLLYTVLVVVLIGGLLVVSNFLGQRTSGRATSEPFESGIVPAGPARLRFSVKFYLIAMFFVIFDLEAVFLFAWAVALRQAGWLGYVEASIFIAILLAALAYLWRMGALDWGGDHRRNRNGLAKGDRPWAGG